MKNKNILLTVCIMLLVSLAAIGCTPARRPVPAPTPRTAPVPRTTTPVPRTTAPVPNQQTIDRNRTTTENVMPRDNRMTTETRTTTGNLSTRADKIVKEVDKIKDVKSSTVVITDRTALVGVNLTSGTKGPLNATIKKEVENAVKKADKDITKVSVTADPDIFRRIENIARDIGKGRPLSGFGKEVEEIIRRITPGA